MEQKIKDYFRSYIFDGVLLILLGVAMLIWPEGALKTLFYIVGAVVGVMGLIKVIMFFTGKNAERQPSDLVLAFAELAIGIALIVKSDFFIEFFNIVLAIMLAYGAILMFAQAVITKEHKGLFFVLSLVFAAITLVLAVIIFIDPKGFASFMTQLRGIALIIEGLAMIIVLHRVSRDITGSQLD